jgi:hypothetical protein
MAPAIIEQGGKLCKRREELDQNVQDQTHKSFYLEMVNVLELLKIDVVKDPSVDPNSTKLSLAQEWMAEMIRY